MLHRVVFQPFLTRPHCFASHVNIFKLIIIFVGCVISFLHSANKQELTYPVGQSPPFLMVSFHPSRQSISPPFLMVSFHPSRQSISPLLSVDLHQGRDGRPEIWATRGNPKLQKCKKYTKMCFLSPDNKSFYKNSRNRVTCIFWPSCHWLGGLLAQMMTRCPALYSSTWLCSTILYLSFDTVFVLCDMNSFMHFSLFIPQHLYNLLHHLCPVSHLYIIIFARCSLLILWYLYFILRYKYLPLLLPFLLRNAWGLLIRNEVSISTKFLNYHDFNSRRYDITQLRVLMRYNAVHHSMYNCIFIIYSKTIYCFTVQYQNLC